MSPPSTGQPGCLTSIISSICGTAPPPTPASPRCSPPSSEGRVARGRLEQAPRVCHPDRRAVFPRRLRFGCRPAGHAGQAGSRRPQQGDRRLQAAAGSGALCRGQQRRYLHRPQRKDRRLRGAVGLSRQAELEEAGAHHIAAAPEDILTLVLTKNRAEVLRRGLALFALLIMVCGLLGLFYFLITGNGAGMAACVILPALAGFAAVRMTRRE